MLLSRALGVIGRFCISLGVLTLLFVAYQLWGTGLLTAQAQNDLENDFEELLAEAQELTPALQPVTVEGSVAEPDQGPADEADEDPDAAVDGGPGEDPAEEPDDAMTDAVRELWSNLLWRPNGEPVAHLSIPAIDLDWFVVAGVGTDELRNGPGHYPSTPLPGMAGNAGIAGHRTTWGAPFNRIDELEPGDIITAQTPQGVFEYRVIEQETGKGHFIVSPSRVDVLDQDFVDAPNRLTLTACHPKFSARQRIIVVAELIGETAPFIPRPGALADAGSASLASEDFSGDDADGSRPQGTSDELPGDPDLAEDDPEVAATDPETGPEPAVASESEDGASEEPAAVPLADDDPPAAAPAGLQGAAGADNFGEGLNGDRGAIMPAIMWGLAATAIAAAAGFIARRWKKWPSYALAVAPFALVLFVCFVHIDQALPSY